MSASLNRQDVRGFAIIGTLIALLAGATYFIISGAVERQIQIAAEQTAEDWADYFAEKITDIEEITAGRQPNPKSIALIEELMETSKVFRFKIFDAEGYLTYISDDGHEPANYVPRLESHNEKAEQAVASGESFTKVATGTPPERPMLYAETYMPIVKNGKTIAVVEVYVDETRNMMAYRKSFSIAILSTLVIVVVAFGAPATAFYVRTRQKKKADLALADTHRKTSAVLANVAQGIALFDEHKNLVLFNDQFALIYDIPPSQLHLGMSLRDILKLRVENGVYPGDDSGRYIEDRLDWVSEDEGGVLTEQMNDGRTIAIVRTPVPEGGYVITHTDISAIKEAEDKAQQLSNFDTVTGLLNRPAFGKAITEAISEGNGGVFAVLCLDLSNFKSINEAFGHQVGDVLLHAVGERIGEICDGRCTIARLGNDEFAILQRVPSQPDTADVLAGRLSKAISAPFEVAGEVIDTSANVGISVYPMDGASPEELIRNADVALRGARTAGCCAHRFYEAEMDEQIRDRRRKESDLRKAVDEAEFELHYQPLIETSSGKISGCEALLRWNHPERGRVSPDEFIPLAEECGLIGRIGDWVVRQAFSDAGRWPDHIKVAVNVSTIQLKGDGFVAKVTEALSNSGIDPTRVEIEITESIFMDDDDETLRRLSALREMGIRVVMDDFGTGYSSLGYLRSFPFDKLKLDRCFTRDLGLKGEAASIVQAVSALGTSLGMTTTAEGVETPEQFTIIRAAGYKEAQGYLFSAPAPLAEIERKFFSDDKDSVLFDVA